jgi:hypothetical protein
MLVRVLSKKWFKEIGDIPLQIVDSLVTAGLGEPATQTLVDLGCDTKLVERVGLKLQTIIMSATVNFSSGAFPRKM